MYVTIDMNEIMEEDAIKQATQHVVKLCAHIWLTVVSVWMPGKGCSGIVQTCTMS